MCTFIVNIFSFFFFFFLFFFFFFFVFFFFFQAEDGIRDTSVTGVQTCALPISWPEPEASVDHPRPPVLHESLSLDSKAEDRELGLHRCLDLVDLVGPVAGAALAGDRRWRRRRSEERRVGEEGGVWGVRWD